MTEYINKADTLQKMWKALYKLEDIQEEQEEFDAILRFYIQKGFEVALKTVIDEPTIDIVHCKDCKHNVYGECRKIPLGFDIACYDQWVETEDDFFCKYGENK